MRIGSIGGMALAQSNGITVEYHERGEGEPLLLVMGLGGQLIDWPQGFVEALVARGFRVISFDNRDAGLSTEIDADPPTRPELAKAIVLRRPLAAHYNLANIYRESGSYDLAIAAYQTALELNPSYHEARGNLALAHQARGETGAAIEILEKLAASKPDDIVAHINLGNAWRRSRL